jgi:hypothetical protein
MLLKNLKYFPAARRKGPCEGYARNEIRTFSRNRRQMVKWLKRFPAAHRKRAVRRKRAFLEEGENRREELYREL